MRLRSLIVGSLLFVPSSAVSQVRQVDMRLRVDEVIDWLPTTIETMIVATRPIDPGRPPTGPNDVSALGYERLRIRCDAFELALRECGLVGLCRTTSFRRTVGRDGGDHSGRDTRPNPA